MTLDEIKANPEKAKELIDSMREDVDFLQRLHDAGVDNWTGYHYGFSEDDE